MSLREINKDHLSERVKLELFEIEPLLLDHQDPLQFWTEHPTENFCVDLTVFATGMQACKKDKRYAGPFSGRPKLIRQLAPAIALKLTGVAESTAKNNLHSLRAWWRLLDAVEIAAAQTGQLMSRVEDVRQLTEIHATYANGDTGRPAMSRIPFTNFKQIANTTLKDLGEPELHWASPEDPKPERSLPTDDDCKELRIRLKQEWNSALSFFAQMDRVRAEGFLATNEDEESLLAHWRHISDVQKSTGKALPSSEELRKGMSEPGFRAKSALSLPRMRLTAFPDHWQAETAFHCCLMTTGWNQATLFSLDATNASVWLRDHPRNSLRYLLVGTKARAGNAEQPVEGLWKTRAGPGYIIKVWLERLAPLRAQLQVELAAERDKYRIMGRERRSPAEMTRQMQVIIEVEEGCRSTWLFVGPNGRIGWLSPRGNQRFCVGNKQTTFLTAFLAKFNLERTALGNATPLPHVTPSDFRDMFATYVWRMSGGNFFALMRALHHTRIRTTEGYADTHHLNIERDEEVRRFLDHLFRQLGKDRFDITILAHLQRFGILKPDEEQRLQEYRALQRSRINVGCIDPFHPPPDMKPPGEGRKVCGPQRCLLCKTHAVVLPESLDGVAMRVEELEFTKSVVPVDAWSGKLAEELANGLDLLNLFSLESVHNARKRWQLKINSGHHRVPGFFPSESQREPA